MAPPPWSSRGAALGRPPARNIPAHDWAACGHTDDIMPSHRLTIRNVDQQLLARLRAVSDAAGKSLNATVLRLLRDAVGMDVRRERFRRYVTWTDEEAEEFDAALRAQRGIDQEQWT